MPKEKLSILLYSGDFDKVHYALAIASAAAAIDTPVTVFVTMGACKAFAYRKDGTERWPTMPLSSSMHSIAIEEPKELNEYYRTQDIATFKELLKACVELKVTFMVCEMGLRVTGIALSELRPECNFQEGGLVTFLSSLEPGGHTITI